MVDKALKIDGNCKNAWVNKGNIQQALGFNDKARDCYEKAVDIDMNFALPHTNLGNLEYLKSNFEQAAYSYLQSLEKDPSDEDTLCNLGLALAKT